MQINSFNNKFSKASFGVNQNLQNKLTKLGEQSLVIGTLAALGAGINYALVKKDSPEVTGPFTPGYRPVQLAYSPEESIVVTFQENILPTQQRGILEKEVVANVVPVSPSESGLQSDLTEVCQQQLSGNAYGFLQTVSPPNSNSTTGLCVEPGQVQFEEDPNIVNTFRGRKVAYVTNFGGPNAEEIVTAYPVTRQAESAFCSLSDAQKI